MRPQAKALTRRDVMDLIRAALILVITVIGAVVVPPSALG
jgi:hypothetical protein